MSCVPWGNETQRADWYKKEYEYAQKKLQHYEDLEKELEKAKNMGNKELAEYIKAITACEEEEEEDDD